MDAMASTRFTGKHIFRYKVAISLFGDTVPSVSTAKLKEDNAPHFEKQSLLQPLIPTTDVTPDQIHSENAICWKVKSISTALKILAAAAAREQEFAAALSGVTSIVPSLQFQEKIDVVQKRDMHLTSVSDALLMNFAAPSVRSLSTVAQFLVPASHDEDEDYDLASGALAMLIYCFSSSSASSCLSSLGAQSQPGELLFSSAVAVRLDLASRRAERSREMEVSKAILDLVGSELSDVLLGLPHQSLDGLPSPGASTSGYEKTAECFSVILSRLADEEFLRSHHSAFVASRCFEIIFGLMKEHDSAEANKRVAYILKRLNKADFWNRGALRFLAKRDTGFALLAADGETNPVKSDLLHGAAWFFDGLAFYLTELIHSGKPDALSQQSQQLLSRLLYGDYHLLSNLLDFLPLEDDELIAEFPQSIIQFQSHFESCMHRKVGPEKVVAGYLRIDTKELRKKIEPYNVGGSYDAALTESIAWAERWNEHVDFDCASSHASSSAMNLLEASLGYSEWSLQPSVSGLLHNAEERKWAHERGLLVLLDQILDKLIGESDGRVSMSQRLRKTTAMNMCGEVLLLVDRYLGFPKDSAVLSHFTAKVGQATLSSLLQAPGSYFTVDDEERSIVLGSTFAKLLEAQKPEIPREVQEIVGAIVVRLAEFSCRQVNPEKADETTLRNAKVSMVSRTIIASMMASVESSAIENEPNVIVAKLATATSTYSTSKTALQALVQATTTHDEQYLYPP